MVMLLPLLWVCTTVVIQFPVLSAIKCIVEDVNGQSNETVEKCDNNYKACSVLWTGPTAEKAVISQRACWTDTDTADTANKCDHGPCIPNNLNINSGRGRGVAYFCCCKGDLCNKSPEPIAPQTTEPPISDPRIQLPQSTSHAWWYKPCIGLLSSLLVLATLVIAAYILLKWRKRATRPTLYADVENPPGKKSPHIDLTKQLCSLNDTFPHQIWLGSYRTRHSSNHPKQTNNNHSVSLLGEDKLTVRVSDQASAVRWSRETRVLSSVALSHPHVVSVLWWGKKHRKSWLVYRDVYVGSLSHVLTSCSLSVEQVKRLTECIFSGLSYLHCTIHAGSRSKIALAHGDISSDNIFLKPNYVPVLGNFHNSIRLQYSNFDKLSTSVETLSKLMSTNHYLAPELFHSNKSSPLIFDNSFRQMDVYSASLVIWQILNRCLEGGAMPHCLPYEDMVGPLPSLAHMATVVKDTRPTLYSSWIQHPELKKLCWLVQLSWKAVPSQRLTAHCIHRLLRDPAALDAICGGRSCDTDI